MPTTYEPIATTTLSTATASVTFSSISGSYTDLVLVINAGMANAGASWYAYVNSDTGNNYSATGIYGNGSTVSSSIISNWSNELLIGSWIGFTTTIKTAIVHFMNYSNTTTYKTVLSRYSESDGTVESNVSLWRNTAAITTIQVRNNSSYNFISGSTFTLYGIKAA